MILTVDIGNTAITLGGFEGDTLGFVARLSTRPADTADELAVRLLDVLTLYGVQPADLTGAIVASVVPPLNAAMRGALARLLPCEPMFVAPGIKSGIGIRCDMPSSVGADIIAACVAVHYLYGSPALILDLGTATKMTVVSRGGAFIGTAIAPGVRMGLDALAEGTAQLPRIELERPASVIAKNTTDCMRSGVLYGHAAMLDGMIDRIVEEHGEPLRVYATGGMAEEVIPLCRHAIAVDPDLVLKGLHLLYRKNTPAD